jgi:peptidoglycan hydrolase-like protein with peptidoglycan-binding domain
MTKLLITFLVLGVTMSSVLAQTSARSAKLSEPELLNCKRKLQALGYWIETPDGRLDESTLAAIKAFRRINGYWNVGQPNTFDLPALLRARPLKAKAQTGPHFEVDLKRQILWFVDDLGSVSLILPVSTGNGRLFTEGGRTRRARTPKGRFTIYRKEYGWRQSPLGRMYYPSYIVGGVTIHGSLYVTDYPRTFGCVAVPMFAAEKLNELMPIGTVILIHG